MDTFKETKKLMSLSKLIYSGYLHPSTIRLLLNIIEMRNPDIFHEYDNYIENREWDIDYLENLHRQVKVGALSKGFLEHLSDVAYEVRVKKRVCLSLSIMIFTVVLIVIISK